MKELRPEMVATCAGSADVYEGHAFLVEAAVSLGGQDVRPGINVFRFANRIPLLFEAGSDVITQTAQQRIAWNSYKINQATDRVGVFVSIVSSKIPFKGAGKEYIADDVEPIRNAVKSAIQSCCVQLKSKIARIHAHRERQNRKKNLTKYVPDAAAAIYGVLDKMIYGAGEDDEDEGERGAGTELLVAALARAKRARQGLLPQEVEKLLQEVGQGQVTSEVLQNKLAEHVERTDTDNALEFQLALGRAQGWDKDTYLVPRSAQHTLGHELHAQGAVFKLLEPCWRTLTDS
jgi:hypothetical protein